MTSYTLFSQAAPTGLTGQSTSGDQVLGVIFTVSQSCALNGIWFYSPATSTALPSAVAVYTVSGQASVVTNSSPSWSGAAGSGWVFCDLSSSAVTLSASTQYCAAVYNSSAGSLWDSYSAGYWTTGGGGASGVTSGPLSAPNSAGGNTGVLLNSAGGSITYPTSSFSSTNYWADVQVTPSASASAPQPLVSPSPAAIQAASW